MVKKACGRKDRELREDLNPDNHLGGRLTGGTHQVRVGKHSEPIQHETGMNRI